MRRLLLSSASLVFLAPPLHAQQAQDAEEAIVVTAPRGSVPGDIAPEEVLDARDIAATGASSIDELLSALSPQVGSSAGRGGRGGGGRPIVLIEGKRVSGWRELRDLPTEAIERVDILPEEAALKYGYGADQRVVNFVLRERFNSTAVELEGGLATDGGRTSGELELDKLLITNGRRTTLALEIEGRSALTEDERDIALQPVDAYPDPIDPRPDRTLSPASEDYQFTLSHSRQLGETSMTVTGALDQSDQRSTFGPPVARFDVPADSPFADPAGSATSVARRVGDEPLGRTRRSRNAELSAAFNGGGDWQWSSTGTIAVGSSRSFTARGPDTDAFQLGLDALDPAFDPYGPLALPEYRDDVSRARSVRAEVDGLLSGEIGETGAGPIGLSLRPQASWSHYRSEGTREGIADEEVELARRRLLGRANLDVPLLDRDSAIGQFGINASGEIESLSDFGELTSLGAGFNWRPTRKLSILASWEREEGAPSLFQLGDARVVEPLTRFFDFTTGETVLVDAITGGNPELAADTRTLTKLAGNWDLPTRDDVQLSVEYIRERIEDPSGSFPAASATLEAAFPDRFVRDADGTLVAVDLTPVNYARQRRDEIRWGLSWSKEIEAKEIDEETRAKMRERFRQMRGERGQATPPPADVAPAPQGAPSQGQPQPPGQPQGQQGQQGQPQPQGQQAQSPGQAQGGPPRGGRGPGGGGFGMFGPGSRGGRLGLNLYHTVNLNDDVLIAEGLPLLDYLDGEAASRLGGTPRHEVELQAFRYHEGLGFRASANWRSATTVDGAAGPIRFGDYARVDLRLWYNLAEKPEVLVDHPWMRGMRVRLAVDNLFNARPRVTGPEGDIPLGYQPGLLEPEGRTVSLSLRKLFVPRRFWQQGGQAGRGRGN